MTMARRMVFQRRRRSERTTHAHTHAHTSSLDLIPSESVRVVPCVLVDVADRAIVACRVVSCYFYFLSYCYRCLYTHTHTHFINTERKKKKKSDMYRTDIPTQNRTGDLRGVTAK